MLIVAIGDSLTRGFPLEPYSWTDHLRELPADLINVGLNGDTLAGMLSRIQRDVLDEDPALCFFMGGSNDAFLGRDAEDMRREAETIQRTLADRGIRTVAGVPPPSLFPDLEQRLDPFRDWIQKNLQKPLDFRAAFLENDEIRPEFLPDGVHPSREAYGRMGKIALEFFRALPA